MTDRATLEALLARVLEGGGQDRELDGQLALLKGYTYEKHKGDKFPWWRKPDGFRISIWGDQNKPPPYTTSLDAALTLVPEGWLYELHSGNDEDWAEVTLFPYLARATFWTRAPTPARALIAACLKARMAAQGE